MRNLSLEQGFTITEMMVATAIVLVVLSGALTTFKNALAINDSASQLADANQNLRAGTNQLIRDIMMAGRIIGTEGIAMPTGPGITYARPGPVGVGNFDMIADTDATLQMPAISTGYHLGPKIPSTCTATPRRTAISRSPCRSVSASASSASIAPGSSRMLSVAMPDARATGVPL